MDAFKIIPQLFFDIIARIVPGIVALALFMSIHPYLTWSGLLRDVSGGLLGSKNAFGFVFFGSLFAGFVIGHLLSPLAKLLETLTASDTPMPWRRYDWLRVHRADAGALAAKIRAEYTMHFSFAAVFGLAWLGCLGMKVFQLQAPNWLALAVLVVISVSSLLRARAVRNSFGSCVEQLYAAAMQELPVPPLATPPVAEPNHDR